MTEKAESRDGLPPPRLYTLSSGTVSPQPSESVKAMPLSTQVKELTKELRAQLKETQKLPVRTRIR